MDKLYKNGEPPYTKNLEALQIAFDETDVVTGTYSVGGDAPIYSSYISIMGETFESLTATDGQIIVSSVEEEWSEGSFAFSFGDKQISGEYMIPYCTNLVR